MSAVPSSYEPSLSDRARWFFRRQWERLFPPKSNLEAHAEQELRAAGFYDADADYGGLVPPAVLALVKVFARQGHSGFSANLVRNLFHKIAAYEPLVPLQGTDDEWCEVSEGTFQNKRCHHVFKDADGRAYDIDGKIFREPDGACYTNRESHVYVTFPYAPTREYVDVPARD